MHHIAAVLMLKIRSLPYNGKCLQIMLRGGIKECWNCIEIVFFKSTQDTSNITTITWSICLCIAIKSGVKYCERCMIYIRNVELQNSSWQGESVCMYHTAQITDIYFYYICMCTNFSQKYLYSCNKSINSLKILDSFKKVSLSVCMMAVY